MNTYLLQISIKGKERVEMILYRNNCHQLFKLAAVRCTGDTRWHVGLTRIGDPERIHGRDNPIWSDMSMALPYLYMTDVLEVVKWGRGLMNALCPHHYEIDWSVNA